MKHTLLILLIAFFGLLPAGVRAQKVISSSEPIRPDWLARRTPPCSNSTFYYQVTEGEHAELNKAEAACLMNLTTYVKQQNQVEGSTLVDIEKTLNGEKENYKMTYIIRGQTISIGFRKADEYWEYISFPDGSRLYRCYSLYALAQTTETARLDEISFTRKYGGRGFARSLIIPGWGQMYKGSTVKGISILGGEALLVGGIIVAENMRASYQNKWKQQKNKNYLTKMDNCETARNVCIGVAAALYVYNLIDALVANGRKRTVVGKKGSILLAPSVDKDHAGMALSWNF